MKRAVAFPVLGKLMKATLQLCDISSNWHVENKQHPTRPYEAEFELDFFNEEPQWKLFGFTVITRNPE